MRTYDPADRIVYVHLARSGAAPATPSAHGECRPLPAGYANVSLRARLGATGAAAGRPSLVVLPGGAATDADAPAPAAPALRLAR
jgi:hypothetical protein